MCAVGRFKHLHKPPILLFFWPCFKNWKASLCNIPWHKISFYTLQFTALNWRCLAWNALSVIRQGNVSSSALNPHLQAWAKRYPSCSRAWRRPSQKTVKSLLLQQIDEVYLEGSAAKAGNWRETLRQRKRRKEAKAGNGFSILKGISCYMMFCGRMRRTRRECETDI